MAYIILLYILLFQSIFHTPEPAARFLIEIDASNKNCFETWWTETSRGKQEFSKRKLPFDNWLAVAISTKDVQTLKSLSCIVTIVEDKKIQWRDDIDPNDPSFISQGDMELIGMPEAWDISNGGLTGYGDTIVVAVIDNGFQLDHVDLKQNIWRNKAEIPDDDIDNDNNGYTDDYVGLNVDSGDDVHPPGNHHGTSVLGIIGARGNNNIGVAGVNWNIQMLVISGANFESELIECYEYVYELRRKYRITNGVEGALVVVTNLSGGIENEFGIDHPLWCNMYEKLGEEGILSVSAAPNRSYSVDIDGDMPSTCNSEYLIAVTNVDLTDNILSNAGFGPESIDIAAPGHGTVTTGGNNTYREFPGTSAAAPHVTGAIALLYSTPCLSLLQNVRTQPDVVALMIKDILLNTGKNNNSLAGLTVTGKRLQVDAAMRESIGSCDTIPPSALSIISAQPNPSASGLIRIFFAITGDTTNALFDLNTVEGKYIRSFAITAQEFQQGYIDLFAREPLPAGLYFLTLSNGRERSTVKIISGF